MKRILATLGFLLTTAFGQDVRSVGNFVEVVADLDRSITFYRDGIGLEMDGTPGTFTANAGLSALFNATGTPSRTAKFKIPESDLQLELVQFQGAVGTTARPRAFDSGAIQLTFFVEDLERVKDRLARIKGLDWASAHAGSATVGDPDGLFVEMSSGRMLGQVFPVIARLSVNVEDGAKTGEFYQKALGFYADRGSWMLPGDYFPVRFNQSGYVERRTVRLGLRDPGAGILQLRATNFDKALQASKSAGATVVSQDGEPVTLDTGRSVILRDPTGLYFQLIETAAR